MNTGSQTYTPDPQALYRKFSAAQKRARNAGFSYAQIQVLATLEKGAAIKTLHVASMMVGDGLIPSRIISIFENVFPLSRDFWVIRNYGMLMLDAERIRLSKINKILKKAKSAEHIHRVLPEIFFVSTFARQIRALELALECNVAFKLPPEPAPPKKKRKSGITAIKTNPVTLGEMFPQLEKLKLRLAS